MAFRITPLLACVLLCIPAGAAAQIMSGMRNQPTARDLPTMPLDTNVASDVRPTFRLKVTRVEVSALVVDANGHPVRDLKANEFEVYDGGRKQNIQSFAAYTYNGGSITVRNEAGGLWNLTAGTFAVVQSGAPSPAGSFLFQNAGTMQGAGNPDSQLNVVSVGFSNTGTISNMQVNVVP